MPIKRLSQTSLASFQKHSNMLAGNPAFSPYAFDLLETTVLGSSASSVTFSSLGSYSAYKHLQIRYAARTDRAAGFDNLLLTLNGDSGANYAYHWVEGNGGSVISNGASSQNYAILGYLAANNSIANDFGVGVIDILDAYSSSKNTTMRSSTGILSAATRVALFSGLWVNTAAVTSISLSRFGSNFVSGSRFSLYGVK